MKNEFRVMGDTTVIIVKCKGVMHSVFIDTADLDLVNSVDGTWCIAYDKNGKIGRVVCAGKMVNGIKSKDISMHKLIMNYDGSLPVDHIDRNPLNNKSSNLRMSTIAENGQNRSLNRNSKTGVRGLNWNSTSNKYQARVQVNGKRKTIGYFETIEEGEKALREFRTQNTTSID